MIQDERDVAVEYDSKNDSLRMAGPPIGGTGALHAQVLVGKDRTLIGFDLAFENVRVAWMLGAHEDVEEAVPTELEVEAAQGRIAYKLPNASRVISVDRYLK